MAKKKGKIVGIKVSALHIITHLLFVYDVLLFGNGFVDDWITIQGIINLFCEALGMEVSVRKFVFLQNNISNEVLDEVQRIFPYHMDYIDVSFKYLDYFLKPNCYRKEGWNQILQKVDKRISN